MEHKTMQRNPLPILALVLLIPACAGDTRTPGQAFGDFMLGFAGRPDVALQHQRLRMQQAQEQQEALAQARRPAPIQGPDADDPTVYSARECIGPVIMGRCDGTLQPHLGYHETCYGDWLNGKCIGPQY
jgi:hypothetical protein